MNGTLDCRRTEALASRFLDGRLRAQMRRRVQEHLQDCPACMSSFCQLRELIQRSGELSARAAMPGLAAVVRDSVTLRRQGVLADLGLSGLGPAQVGWSVRRVGMLAGAAALMLAVGYGAGFWVGQQADDSSPTGRLVEAPLPNVPATARLAGFDPQRFERAARGLVHDIEWIDSVPAPGRRPMLAAQLEYFDLDSQAVQVLAEARSGRLSSDRAPRLTELAQFVHELATDLADGSREPVWETLRQDARRRGLLQDRSGTDTRRLHRRRDRQDPVRLRAVVDEVGGRLGSADRISLRELLELKESFVEGRVEASVRFVGGGAKSRGMVGKMFALPVGAVVVRTLSEAGLEDAARTVVMGIATTRSGPSKSGTQIHISATAQSGTVGEGPDSQHIRALMEQLRKQFGAEFEIGEPPVQRRQ